jgi:hypothetical protein
MVFWSNDIEKEARKGFYGSKEIAPKDPLVHKWFMKNGKVINMQDGTVKKI